MRKRGIQRKDPHDLCWTFLLKKDSPESSIILVFHFKIWIRILYHHWKFFYNSLYTIYCMEFNNLLSQQIKNGIHVIFILIIDPHRDTLFTVISSIDVNKICPILFQIQIVVIT